MMKKVLVETESCKKYCSENDGVDEELGVSHHINPLLKQELTK